jgi:RNA polymerase sigma-70 factor (ECF subfamily)
VSFGEIAEIVGRTPAAARQLASRARRRVQGAEVDEAELSRQRPVVEAFMTALKTADFDALMRVLDPDVLVRGPGGEVRGAKAWAKGAMQFAQSVAMPKVADSVRLAIVNGNVGIVFAPHGNVVRVIELVVDDGVIRELEVVMEPARVQAYDVEILPV